MLYSYIELFLVAIRRDIANRSSGTFFGSLWLILQPMLQFVSMWILLNYILKVKFSNIPGGFLRYYLIGMVVWFTISESISKSSVIFKENEPLIAKNQFPLWVPPISSALVIFTIYGFVIVLMTFYYAGLSAVFFVSLLYLMLFIWILPFVFILSIVSVFIRDVQQITPFILSALLYLSPIFYVPEMFPQKYYFWLEINPIAVWLSLFHSVMNTGGFNLDDLLFLLGVFIPNVLISIWIYMRTHKYIREVL